MKCSEGTVPMPFKSTPRTTKISGLIAGNALDVIPVVNIPSFVICKKLTQMAGGTPVPCTPVTLGWEDTHDVKVGGAEAVVFQSCLHCTLGQGKIEFITSGQLPLPPAVSQSINETKKDGKDILTQAQKEQNAVGEAGLAEGLIPIWGSGRDLINAVQTGDKVGMALNAAFLVWDVASVVAGAFSFGTATAAMMVGKAGLRTALKAAGKVAAKAAEKKMVAFTAKSAALKEGIPAAMKGMREFVTCKLVKGCFPAGTLIAVAQGYEKIENLRIGNLVWSWDEQAENLVLSPVEMTQKSYTHNLVHFRIGSERISATPEHPFLVGQQWKEAAELKNGDAITRSDGGIMVVNDVEHELCERTEVFNIEVGSTHNYLVGQWMILAHNACDVLEEIYALIGKRKLNALGSELLETIKQFKNKTIHVGSNRVIIDKQSMTHILGRHHPSFKLDEKAATMFPAHTSADDITDTIQKILHKNPEKVDKLLKNGGRGQIDETIDGVRYRLGMKDRGHIGQFFPLD